MANIFVSQLQWIQSKDEKGKLYYHLKDGSKCQWTLPEVCACFYCCFLPKSKAFYILYKCMSHPELYKLIRPLLTLCEGFSPARSANEWKRNRPRCSTCFEQLEIHNGPVQRVSGRPGECQLRTLLTRIFSPS